MNFDQPRRDLVLVVEDEESFVEALSVGLTREGFEVAVARDGEEALTRFKEVRPDLVLLDLMLPKLSGLEVCRALRWESKVPIIIVTAKASEIDAVVGLEMGADDYVTKPYRLRELMARMRAVLRRSEAGRATEDGPGVLTVGSLSLDVPQHVVQLNGRRIVLPLKEFKLLRCLMEQAGRVVWREVLLEAVWGSEYQGSTKTLDAHVKRIRAKIEDDPRSPKRLVTVRGIGYRFEENAW